MLGPEVQGEWYLYINAFTFGTIALGLGLPPALNHFIAAGKIDRKHLVGQLLFFALCVGLVFFLLIVVLIQMSTASFLLPKEISNRIVLVGLVLHFVLLIFNQLIGSVLLAEKKFIKSAFIAGLGSVLLLIAYVGFQKFFSKSPNEYFLWLIAVNVLVLIIQSLLYLLHVLRIQSYQFTLRFFSRNSFLLLLGFAAWAYSANLVQFFNYKMDLWFISAYESEEARLGVYGVAASLAQLIWLIPSAFHSVIFTSVSTESKVGETTTIKKWSQRIFLYALLLAILGYVLSFFLVPILFGAAYTEIVEILPLILPGIVVFAPAMLYSAYFAGINRIRLNFNSSMIGFVVCLAFNIVLIPLYSVLGAAIASSISYAASAAYLYYMFRKSVRLG